MFLEQYTAALPSGVGTWLRERKPASLLDAARLTQDYWDARGGKDALPPTHTAAVPKSHLPGSSQYPSHGSSQMAYRPELSPRPRNSGPPRCYSCGERGHIALRCPKARTPVMYTDALPTDRSDASDDQHDSAESDLLGEAYYCQPAQPAVASPRTTPEVVVTGVVNGYQVSNIVVDTACAQTMIHQDLVPDSKLVRQCVTILCAHGDELQYSLADIEIEVGDYFYYVRADVSDRLPRPVFLGRDIPDQCQLLPHNTGHPKDVCLVTTRSQSRATPDGPVGNDATLQDIFNFEDSLFEQFAARPSAAAKSTETLIDDRQTLDSPTPPPSPADAAQFAAEQREDVSLQAAWTAAKAPLVPSDNQTRFHIHQGLLYRKFHLESKDGAPDLYDRSQLVLPATRRPAVLHLAHSVPMAGHMGRDKNVTALTAPVLVARDYQGCHRIVHIMCSMPAYCPHHQRRVCHIDSPSGYWRAVQIYSHERSWPTLADEIGKNVILTIVDYATRYPEAIPLSSIDAETIADALITFFSRVGLPDTILTDQGTNFTSDVVRQVAAMLRIRLITSTPYHQQTDGLVERFNGTLKSMIRCCAHDTPRSWDALLPFVLFAYREVPQSSTGFLPFELLCGRHIRGPLDLVKEAWSQSSDETLMTTAQYVIAMRERLDLVAAAAADNLRAAQTRRKHYYDIHSRNRSLSPGDEVLLLLPSSPRKLESS